MSGEGGTLQSCSTQAEPIQVNPSQLVPVECFQGQPSARSNRGDMLGASCPSGPEGGTRGTVPGLGTRLVNENSPTDVARSVFRKSRDTIVRSNTHIRLKASIA